MRKGKTLVELAQEVERQQRVKADFIADSRALELVVEETEEQKRTGLEMTTENGPRRFTIGDTCHAQLADRLKIPKVYYDRMLAEAPELLAQNANHWLHTSPSRRMLRTLDGRARALLSDKYRPLDHADLLEAVLPSMSAMGLDLLSAEVTERRLYLQARSRRLEGEVKVGDVVQGGIVISNSEIGGGSLRIERLLYRLICLNGMVTGDALRQAHVGRKHAGGIDLGAIGQELLTDRTRALDDAAFFSKVRDVVRHVCSPEAFQGELAMMRGATERSITGDPAAAVERVSTRLQLSEDERGGVLRHLIGGGDLSAWGVANAVTRLAHDSEDYDRSVELERAGAQVIQLKASEWREIADAA